MNFYYYWYYTIYHIYNKFSRDRDFDVYAIGLFSVIVGFSFIGLTGVLSEMIGFHAICFQNRYMLYTYGLSILAFNGFLFFKKNSQIRLYDIYLEERKWWKDVLFIGFSIFFISLSIYYVECCSIHYPSS